jgi:hypothetical protein
MMRIVSFSVIALITASAGVAQTFMTGNDLSQSCRGLPLKAGSYIMGVVDTHNSISAAADSTMGHIRFCVPEGATGEQLLDVVCTYVQDNPQHRHYAGSVLVWAGISAAFPC